MNPAAVPQINATEMRLVHPLSQWSETGSSMSLHIVRLPRLIAERRSSAIFGMVIIAMLWAGIALKYFEDVQADQRDAERTNQNFAMVFEENVLRSIGEIDKALLYLRRSIETRQGSTDFHTIVNTTDVLSEIIVQVAIIDAKGIMRASNVGPQPAPPIDLSDREHYRVHLDSNEDKLFISKPVVGRASGQWSVQFTRRFLDRNGAVRRRRGGLAQSQPPDQVLRQDRFRIVRVDRADRQRRRRPFERRQRRRLLARPGSVTAPSLLSHIRVRGQCDLR